jgi:hypothetical protein
MFFAPVGAYPLVDLANDYHNEALRLRRDQPFEPQGILETRAQDVDIDLNA